MEPLIEEILTLKEQTGATILAHTYQAPEIFHGVADLTGDSLALAQAAASVPGELILVCGVHFMAESVKLLAPQKTVLIPDPAAGCSLADAITPEDVRRLRERHPGVPVVCYVNTSAAVKAECDACCTSANAVSVVESMGSDEVVFVPDRYLGAHVAAQTAVRLHLWHGSCEVHERFTASQARDIRIRHRARLLAHPECPPEVLAEADFVGSTSAMSAWIRDHQPPRVALITECTMADNLRVLHPQIEFVQPCQLCPHMQRITLPTIARALRERRHEVEIDPAIASRARAALERMLAAGRDRGG
ncbi:MAG: quinolinate synthase A [Lysobacteraceae bacterium]|nr:MAG: quinolinate synthase A [Xanthomonadaceae bacterium]